jgi:hypothetical protein
MDWIKKHVDTVIILAAFGFAILWMNCRFNELDKQFSEIHQELAVMKTVLIMKNIMPIELASKNKE